MYSQRVLVQQRQARVVECALVVVRQVLAAHVHHKLVEVHHHHALDGTCAAAPHARSRPRRRARDEYGARVGVRYHRRLHQRLVVHELVKLGGLCLVVQHEAPAKALGVVYEHMLVGGIALEQHLADLLELHQPLGDQLVVPVAFGWSSHGDLHGCTGWIGFFTPILTFSHQGGRDFR